MIHTLVGGNVGYLTNRITKRGVFCKNCYLEDPLSAYDSAGEDTSFIGVKHR